MSDEQIKALQEAAVVLQSMKWSLDEKWGPGEYGTIWWTANRQTINEMDACLSKLRELGIPLVKPAHSEHPA